MSFIPCKEHNDFYHGCLVCDIYRLEEKLEIEEAAYDMLADSQAGTCKFNCRTNRSAFEAGWMAAIEFEYEAEPPDDDEEVWLKRAYKEWRRKARGT